MLDIPLELRSRVRSIVYEKGREAISLFRNQSKGNVICTCENLVEIALALSKFVVDEDDYNELICAYADIRNVFNRVLDSVGSEA